MARVFIDGFESGGCDMWDAESNATVVSSSGLDMDGDYCLDLNSGSEYIQKDIVANDEMYFAFLYRPTHTVYSEQMLSVYNGGTPLAHIARTATSGLIGAKLSSTTQVAIGTKVLAINTTYLIEVHIKIADSGGRIEVKVDGVQDIDYTGDTKPGADTQFDKVRLGVGPYAIWTTTAYFDNFIADDADWIGDTKIQAISPSGAGNSSGWTASAGSNFECVDEIPASDTDYVSINAVDTVDTYVAQALSGSIDSIKCVQMQSRTRTEGSPTPTQLQLVARAGGSNYFSASETVPVAEKGLYNLWELNPDDSAAWEASDVNSMEMGIKSIA